MFKADQYTQVEDHIIETKTGERVIAKRNLTIEYIYSIYYWSINLGSLAGIATTFVEKRVGFWAAYLLPFCVLWISALTLLLCKTRFGGSRPSLVLEGTSH
jgi:POT family proton-dependent oligopeptide transporter